MPLLRTFAVLSAAAFLFLFPTSVFSQGQGVITLQRIQGTVRLDGLSTEPAWSSVQPFLPTQYEPNNGSPATETTEFLVGYDDSFLYLALRAFDRDLNGIRSNTLYRDRLSGDDHFEILIDTFNDNETGMVFTTTPGGIRREAALSNDATGTGVTTGGWLNVDFNTYWDVATQVTDDGWFAEIRIPFSSLRFQPGPDGRVTMGLSMQRKIARKTERLVFPAIKPVANWAFLKPSLAQKVVMEGIRPKLPIYVTPYALTGTGRSAAMNDLGTAYGYDDNFRREIGGDAKISLTNFSTLDLTVNTDFAQVEADDQQINLTRFSLFFPEKRQFFQERAAIFDFRTGGDSRLFHSRRIGLTETGLPVRLLGGARLVGRFGLWDVGVLNMQTGDSDALPSENFGVFRARRQVINPYSYAGGMLTSRVGVDGSYNFAYGADGVFRLFGNDYLTLQWAHSLDDDQIDSDDFRLLNGGRFTAELQRRTRQRWGYNTLLAWAGPDYDPGIGFSQRNDFTLLDNTLAYTWLPGAESSIIWQTLGMRGFTYLRNGDGTVESAEVGPEWEIAAKSGRGGSLEAKLVYENLLVPFHLSEDALVPAGSYTFYRVGASYHETHTGLIQLRPRVEAGTFYDGWQMTGGVTPVWYVSPHLELSAGYQYTRVNFPDRDQRFDAHLTRLRIGTALNTKISTNALLQYNSAADAFSANIRFRYNLREGNDLWIVYNEGLNLDRYRVDPALLTVDNRTLLLKYTHTFGL